MRSKNLITLAEAINNALKASMLKNKKVLLVGLGVNDPKKILEQQEKIQENDNFHLYIPPL